MSSYYVRAVGFHEDGVTIDYADAADDIRTNGLMKNHAIFIPHDAEYADLLDRLVDHTRDALARCLADFDRAEVPTTEVTQDLDDDDSSPYDNPLERDDVLS